MINTQYLTLRRQVKGYTQSKLANEIGVTPVAICCIEGGKRNPSLDMTIKICKALDLDANKLLNLV